MCKKIFIFVSSIFLLLISISYIHAAAVDLVWEPPNYGGEVEGYMVYASTTRGDYSNPETIVITEDTETYGTVSDLDNTQTYYFIARSYNCSGFSDPSNEVEVCANSDSFYDDGSGWYESEDKGGGGCFIATMAFGSPFESYIKILRQFRDSCLITTSSGRMFIKLYFRYSSELADMIACHANLKMMTRWGLAPIVGIAHIAFHSSIIDKIGIVLLIILLLTGYCFYLKKRIKAAL